MYYNGYYNAYSPAVKFKNVNAEPAAHSSPIGHAHAEAGKRALQLARVFSKPSLIGQIRFASANGRAEEDRVGGRSSVNSSRRLAAS